MLFERVASSHISRDGLVFGKFRDESTGATLVDECRPCRRVQPSVFRGRLYYRIVMTVLIIFVVAWLYRLVFGTFRGEIPCVALVDGRENRILCVFRDVYRESFEVKFRVPPSWTGAALKLRGRLRCLLVRMVLIFFVVARFLRKARGEF